MPNLLIIILLATPIIFFLLRNRIYATSADKRKFTEQKQLLQPLLDFVTDLKNNNEFLLFLEQRHEGLAISGRSTEDKIFYLLILDAASCKKVIPEPRLGPDKRPHVYRPSYYPLFYLLCIDTGVEPDAVTIEKMYAKNIVNASTDLIMDPSTKVKIIKGDNKGVFILYNVLSDFDNVLAAQYLSLINDYAVVVASADGTITQDEEEVLNKIKPASTVNTGNRKRTANEDNKSIDELLVELNSLTGLEGVKKEVSLFINFIKIQKAREASGLKTTPISYHLVLTGNPGTGKTTVARILANIYKKMGILTTGQLVETDRSGLIAEYAGQTPVKVNKVIDSALNGVLFIDEAYSLLQGGDDMYGNEAIATLIKRMEDDRDRLVIILAGYTDEMKVFIDGNPGFKSRFNRYINFDDYTPGELLSIYQYQCKQQDYALTDDAKARMLYLFTTAYNTRDRSFGNGRYVRNIFEKSLELQATRLSTDTSLDKTELTTITGDDIPTS